MNKSRLQPEPWEEALEASAHRPKPPNVSRLQIAVYLAYRGNLDLYQLRKRPDPDMFDEAWSIIDSLRQHLTTAASRSASDKYRADVETMLSDQTEDDATRNLLWAIRVNGTR